LQAGQSMIRRSPADPGRRRAIVGVGTLLAAAAMPSRAQSAWRLMANEAGGYRFLPGNPVFAGGAVAEPGFAFVHALLRNWLPLGAAMEAIERHLRAESRPMRALAGLELRLPRQLSVEEFADFNAVYLGLLRERGVLVEGLNPISRTNVAPASAAPEEPSVHAFSYCVPLPGGSRSFVMSGMTEGGPGGVVAAGDVSHEGMRRKLVQVVDAVSRRLEELGMGWADATHIDLYAASEFGVPLPRLLEPALGLALRRGVRTHFGRPPIIGLELELEARALAREIVVGA
jgi:hypothetical protein